jgi:hypothetical protein
MNLARDYFLACAGLAVNQDVASAIRHQIDADVDGADLRACADQ